MNGTIKKAAVNALYVVVVIGAVLAVWWAAAELTDSELVLPGISATFSEFGTVFGNPEFWTGLSGTLLRSVLAYVISIVLFFATYFFAVSFGPFARAADIFVSALRSLPAVAVTLILILAVGGKGTPVVLGVIVIYPMMYSAARARTATVPAELKEVCLICGAGKIKTFSSLWLPRLAGGLPDMLSSAFSYNIKTVIGAEILAQTADGLGMLMKLSQIYLESAMLVAFVIAAVAVSVVCELILKLVLKAVLYKFSD